MSGIRVDLIAKKLRVFQSGPLIWHRSTVAVQIETHRQYAASPLGIGAVVLLALSACQAKSPQLVSAQIEAHPSIWPQARDITCDCGAYQAQEILRAENKNIDIPKLYVSDWDRGQCSTLPWHFSSIFAQFSKIKTNVHYYFSDAAVVKFADHALERGHPVIVLIQATKGHHGLHWISLWGYDARSQSFAVYDSQYPTKKSGLGNARYPLSLLESRFPWWTKIAIEIQK